MIGVTYDYYKNEYYGEMLNEHEFNKYIKRAEPYVSSRTFGKADLVTDATDEVVANKVRDSICAVAEILKSHTGDDGIEHGAVSSENVGGSWSRSYVVNKESSGITGIINDKIYTLLANTGLLYGGGAFDENVSS